MSNEAWDEIDRQTALMVCVMRQVECGLTTHAGGDCGYCGAAK